MGDSRAKPGIGTGGTAPDEGVPPFEPHPWILGPHAQTIVARYLNWPGPRLPSTYAEVDVGGGDRVAVLDSTPGGWAEGDPIAILVHGLSGSARSPYIVRVARRLAEAGVRVVRMNLRGAGAGFGSSRSFYHSGLTGDLRAVAERANRLGPGSPIALVGFSLGANLVLKLAAEAADRAVPGLDCVVAANPPLDLNATCRQIRERSNRVYDRNFVASLLGEVRRLRSTFPEPSPIDLTAVASLYEFDEAYTAPSNGFRDAADYHARSSAGPLVSQIRVPGLVIHAEDDPFIPPESIRQVQFPPQLALELIPQGGHLGYFGRYPWLGDRRWLDARIFIWLTNRWSLGRPASRLKLREHDRLRPNIKEAGRLCRKAGCS